MPYAVFPEKSEPVLTENFKKNMKMRTESIGLNKEKGNIQSRWKIV